uniref:Disease resistance protein RPS5 n=1 Tax=Noccaea caerulescens TaxID=107243 RepID=A0A1J3K4I0_NOCCA
MHDVVREMALWIATDFGRDKERCIVQAGVSLREVPTVENWASVRRMSLMENKIENISDSPECPELTTLLLQKNRLTNISGEFFKSMPRLVVLDLSRSRDFNGLPEEISELVSLRYLDLSRTAIRRLPGGLLKLKMLIYLNLEGTWQLESIYGISNLSSLKTLRLIRSKVRQNLDGMKELQLLEHLEVVTVDIGSILVANQLLNTTRVANVIQELLFAFVKEKDVLTIPNMEVLSTLKMSLSEMVEINIEKRTSWGNKIPTTPDFLNLSTVSLYSCHGLKDLTWLLYAPNLSDLKVNSSRQIEDIISKEKTVNLFAGTIIPFQRLEHFQVRYLWELKSIYWRPLPFPCLRKFNILYCPKLRKLPLDSKSGSSNPGEDLVIHNDEQNWIDEVEWEDETTKERFLPSLQPSY